MCSPHIFRGILNDNLAQAFKTKCISFTSMTISDAFLSFERNSQKDKCYIKKTGNRLVK